MGSKAIVCVDDEAIILIALKQELKNHFGRRFSYEIALNGEEALSVMAELEADGVEVAVVITDWLMPGMKGDELLSAVHERYPAAATILVTGQADEDALARVAGGGRLSACIRKPWSASDLIGVIETAAAAALS